MGIKTRYVKKYLYKSRVRSALVWAVQIIVVLLLAALFSIYMCKSAVVQEGSMDPTLKAGDKVMINTAAYRFSSPQRGDIIAFRLNEDSDSSIHIKRIIGLPGETIMIHEGQVTIDGEVTVPCDRCLEDCVLPVHFKGHPVVKFSEEEQDSDGEVIWIHPAEDLLDLGQYIYESIVLSLPYQRVHPLDALGNPLCNPDMLARFTVADESQEQEDEE